MFYGQITFVYGCQNKQNSFLRYAAFYNRGEARSVGGAV
jgi:hypothetical protein